MNYDTTKMGVPYVRTKYIRISHPTLPEMPSVVIEQSLAVTLADGSVRVLEELSPINISLDMLNDGNEQIPLVSPTDGSPLGPSTTLNQVMVGILAVIRKYQNALGQ